MEFYSAIERKSMETNNSSDSYKNYALIKKQNTKNIESMFLLDWGLKPDQTNLSSYTLEKW